ncbi:hypothetical protein [Sediminicoccus sp. KRV36]|uniref:hypothetical protein n=1 Tax=Sediminicoccus sp. KRV36 TaxID=3133721 RepID=UPI00200E7A71|nr:hypothetical protein [Sediminicoccus rosea]UPY37974.1 hypothetical protein LHU95_04545 [Sediminicoccus rosea]
MARSVIFLSTPTSANGSMFRAISAIGRGRYHPLGWVADHYAAGRMDRVASETPPPQDHLIKHNAPERFNPATPLRDYRFILNTRDPRDLLCNQFHWQFVHPMPGESPETEAARRQHIAAMGMDAWVLAQDFRPLLQGFLDVVRRIAPADRIFIGYAMYCLHFDEVTQRIATFLEAPLATLPPERRAALERERVANLAGNKAWIGQSWAGADTAPGRHRTELQPATIRSLTERYRWFLDFLRRMDDRRVAETYA